MIIKQRDPINTKLEQLEEIKKLPSLPQAKLAQIEKELRILRSGDKGEQDSAYFIDFYYKDAQNWLVIHDLRIEYNNRVAQIDHLLINRFLDFYILETKHYARSIKVTDRGEFLFQYQNKYIAVESPIEQNKRHLKVLEDLVNGEAPLPKRLGFSLRPNFLSYILVTPKSKVIRPKTKQFNTNTIIKADELHRQIEKNIDDKSTLSSIGSLANLVSQETLKEIGRKLITYHRPTSVDYYGKFGIYEVENSAQPKIEVDKKSAKYYCFFCQKPISKKVASFCFSHKHRFKGKAYCYDCQQSFSA